MGAVSTAASSTAGSVSSAAGLLRLGSGLLGHGHLGLGCRLLDRCLRLRRRLGCALVLAALLGSRLGRSHALVGHDVALALDGCVAGTSRRPRWSLRRRQRPWSAWPDWSAWSLEAESSASLPADWSASLRWQRHRRHCWPSRQPRPSHRPWCSSCRRSSRSRCCRRPCSRPSQPPGPWRCPPRRRRTGRQSWPWPHRPRRPASCCRACRS